MPNHDGSMSFEETLTAAMRDIAEHGYDSADRIAYWNERLIQAARKSMKSDADVERMVRETMTGIYRKQVEERGVITKNPMVKPYTLEQIKPELHAELERRIAASVDLIKLDREQAILTTQRRFSGWATSIPAGGEGVMTVKKAEEKKLIRKSLTGMDFNSRRVFIDQGAKLTNAINDTVAISGGAIAGEWQSHKNQPGYNGRPDHNAMDGHIFIVRGSWADQAGYVKPGRYGYTDDVVQPGIPVFCRCKWVWKFSLRSLPEACLTAKGREALEEARRKIAAMR